MSAFNALCRTSSGKRVQLIWRGADFSATQAALSLWNLRAPRQSSRPLLSIIQSAFISNSIAALRKRARMNRAYEFERVRRRAAPA